MSNVNHDTTAINALIKYFRENDLRIHGELANDTNIFTGAVSSADAKHYATLVFVGTHVVLVMRDMGDAFSYVGNVYVSSTPIVHSVESYQHIAFGLAKRSKALTDMYARAITSRWHIGKMKTSSKVSKKQDMCSEQCGQKAV
jgi:hypothetical protein